MKISRYLTVVLGSLLIVAVIGCSDDDTTTGPTDEPEDTEGAIVDELVGDRLFTETGQSLELTTALLGTLEETSGRGDGLPLATGTDSEEITITSVGDYQYVDGWHIWDFEAVVVDLLTHDTIDVEGVDSAKVLVDGEPVVAVPLTGFDVLMARAHVDWDQRHTTNHGDQHHRLDIELEEVGEDVLVEFNGTANDTLTASDESDSLACDFEVSMDQSINNLVIMTGADDDDCPESGTVQAVVGISADCISQADDTVSVSGTWVVTATVNDNNTVTFTYDGPIVDFTVTESCVAASPARAAWFDHNR